MKNINDFNEYINSMVSEFEGEADYLEYNDYAHECADGSEYVIYYSKAWDLVNLVRENDYSLYCDSQPWAFDFESLEHIITSVACSIITNAIMDAFNKQELENRQWKK
jgi:hypothetical protein